MCEVIVITSGKGGVGKTTAVANLGMALARRGAKVALVDTDIGLRNLDVVLGLENRIVFDLVDVCEGECDLKQALVKHPACPHLCLLPAAQTRDKTAVTPDQMREVIAALRAGFDYVLVDCPAGIEHGFQNAVAGADRAIVVTNPEISAVRDADRVIGLLGAHDLPRPRLLINKIRPDMVRRGDMMSVEDILEILDASLLGTVPDDENVIKAVNLGTPVVEMVTPAGMAYGAVAERLLGQDGPARQTEAPQEVPEHRPSKKRNWLSWLIGALRGQEEAEL